MSAEARRGEGGGGEMAESPLTFKRRLRPGRRPLAELDGNAHADGAQVDPEAVFSFPSDGDEHDETESTASASKKTGKGSASKRQRRSGAAIRKELKETPSKGAGTILRRKDKQQTPGSEQNSNDHPGKAKNVRWSMSPEFVKEKREMFAAIDSFELESEEESLDDKHGNPSEIEANVVESRATMNKDKSPAGYPSAIEANVARSRATMNKDKSPARDSSEIEANVVESRATMNEGKSPAEDPSEIEAKTVESRATMNKDKSPEGDRSEIEANLVESTGIRDKGKSPMEAEPYAPSTDEAGPSYQYQGEAQGATSSQEEGSGKSTSASEAGPSQVDIDPLLPSQVDIDPPSRKCDTMGNRSDETVASTSTVTPSDSDSNLHSGGPSMATRSRTKSPATTKSRRGESERRVHFKD